MAAMAFTTIMANHTDTVYVASFRVANGLQMAYSVDKNHWTTVGTNYNLLQSDYGAWGAEKKMASVPSVLRDSDGEWYAVWAVNGTTNQFATTHTHDLACWVPQDYPYVSSKGNVIDPVLTKRGNQFAVTYRSNDGKTYLTLSNDFIHWSKAAVVVSAIYEKAKAAAFQTIPQGIASAAQRAPWDEIRTLIGKSEAAAFRAQRDNRGMEGDAHLFGKVSSIDATLTADLSKSKAISPDLFGIFFEDINYAADGGIYAELLQNRDFEYNAKDRKEWTTQTAWDVRPVSTMTRERGTNWTILSESPIHKNNANYSRLDTRIVGSALINSGYEGIPVKKGDKYNFSVFLRTSDKTAQRVRISLLDGDKCLATTTLTAPKGNWKQLKAVLTPSATCDNAVLAIEPLTVGTIDVDFASLFPQKTFKNRRNGLRADLAQTLADMHPRFIRFPGGCMSHGDGIDNIYHWQATVGPLWERQYDFNIWHYHQSRGLGFYEYFQFCEDIGAEPLPVLAAGVPCQNSAVGGGGQQGGIPWERDLKALADAQGKSIADVAPYMYNGKPLTMESYLQELLDLIEWANGDASKSQLAKMRADAGHKAPFNMKYLGIGNEDIIGEVFKERYLWLISEVKKAHPEITIVGTVGPFWEGSDYVYGWDVAKKNNLSIVDEHYYNPVGWYLNHQDFYDKYDRNGTKVYLGEWASRGNRWENALAEAIHITNVERNADVVVMSSYAPLLAREGHTQWNPDLIYFNNTEVKPTPNYYVQTLSGQNTGSEYIFSNITSSAPEAQSRIKASVVRAENGDVILKLINATPVETKMNVSLGDLSAFAPQAKMQQINAAFDARSVKLDAATSLDTSALSSLTLPAYSFTVVRLQKPLPRKK